MNMGKVVVITGANHGIGAAIAKEMAFTGYDVVITWLDPNKYAYSHIDQTRMFHTMGGGDEADRILREIAENGGKVASFPADLANKDDITALLNFAEREFGSVDTLVNNAAHAESNDTLEACDAGVIDRTYAVNVKAPILLIQEFLKHYKTSGLKKGSIVNISTNAAQYNAFEIHYGASKAALEAYTRALSVALGGYGIRVNAVAPGPVHTGIPQSYITPELEETLNKKIPLGRCGQPADIAKAVRFLVSDDADWITGQVLAVDGGHSWGRCL